MVGRRPDSSVTQLLKRRQCRAETIKVLGGLRQTEAQQIIGPLETSAPDVPRGKRGMNFVCSGVPRELE